MLPYETFDSIIRTDSCLVAHLDRWDAILRDIQQQSVLLKIEADLDRLSVSECSIAP
jgi:hypothetical protein